MTSVKVVRSYCHSPVFMGTVCDECERGAELLSRLLGTEPARLHGVFV